VKLRGSKPWRRNSASHGLAAKSRVQSISRALIDNPAASAARTEIR
jgi:hypothetical protein